MFSLIIDMMILFKCYRRSMLYTGKIIQVIGLPLNVLVALWGFMIHEELLSDNIEESRIFSKTVLVISCLRVFLASL